MLEKCELCCIILMLFTFPKPVCLQNHSMTTFCSFDGGSKVRKSFSLQLQSCCNIVIESVYTEWTINQNSLSTFLEILKTRNCPQFEQECQRRTFAFTNFTQFVYLRYCNYTEMQQKCFKEIEGIVGKNNSLANSTWASLIQNLDVLSLSTNELISPCVQTSMLDRVSISGKSFYEMTALVPFCNVVWCGFEVDVYGVDDTSLWTCIPSE